VLQKSLNKRHKEDIHHRTHSNKIRNEKEDIKTDTEEIQRNLKYYFKSLYFTKLEKSK